MKSFTAEPCKNTVYLASNPYFSQQPVFLKFSPQLAVSLSSKVASSERSKLTQQWISSPEKGTILPNNSTNQIRTCLKIFLVEGGDDVPACRYILAGK